MYLKKLELQGFKSFADKTSLEFMPGITSVIGPNGSGKSNISDGIRWVLGEQSLKSLRGTKSEDVIFAGTQNRKSLGYAEVSIIIDNEDGKLPIEYDEVTVTRRIYRNGETGYFINKTPCRLKDILELFMDTGIGKDGYSIIGQGKIDEILSNKSEERRHIFEEAAGIVKYRVRKADSEKKLEQAKVNLIRINDILSEIEGNLEPLKIQSEKAKKFLNLKEELKKIEIGLFLHNIDTYKEKLNEIKNDIDIYQSQIADEEAQSEKAQKLKENFKIKLDEITSKIEETQNLSFESTNKIEKINSDINVAKGRIASNEENYERYINEIEELELKTEELAKEKGERLNKKTNLSTNRNKFATELEEKEKELKTLSGTLSEEEKKIETKKKKVEENTNKKYEKATIINTSKVNYENLLKQEKHTKDEISNTISELDDKRLAKSDISASFYEIENKKSNMQKQVENINQTKEMTLNKVKEYDEIINEISAELRIKDSKMKFLKEMEREKEGYSRAIKSLLLDCEKDSNLKKGMNGVLANIISVEKEYETAIEMALGQALQNIVTDTEEDAKRLIEHLRNHNLGRASFLPISSVKGKKIDKLITNGMEGVIGIASTLVKVDKKYEDIILNLLGRTVIVDDMDTAISLAKLNKYSFRIVTLKGDVVNPSGAITGGATVAKTSNIIGRKAQIESLEKECKKLEKRLNTMMNEKEEYEKTQQEVMREVDQIERQMQEIEITYATEKQKVIQLEENITNLENKLLLLKNSLINIEEDKNKKLEEQETLKQEISIIEEENSELDIEIKKFAEKNKNNQKYIDDLNFEITNLKISLSSFDESQASIEEIVAKIDKDIENNNISIEKRNKQKDSIEKENKKLELEIEDLRNQIVDIEKQVSNSESIIKNLRQERVVNSTKLEETEKSIDEKSKIIDELKQQVSKTDVKKTKIEYELEQIINRMWDDYELTPNNVQEYKKPENLNDTTKQVKVLRDEIKELGSINIDSIEEYKNTKDRYDFMCEQRLDLEDSNAKLKKVIQDMTKIMKDQFEKQFKIINKNFNEVFKELFGGGRAELKLTDDQNILECGIEIEVEPPGKKLQSMSLLSGGEKAFTAIALLFAILKINPAPFCVLDEIEAALDDVNVYRFAEYLKKFSKDTQFLVITHRKGTMEAANTVYGITMEENGISKLLSMKLK